jgi:hypothetical protein
MSYWNIAEAFSIPITIVISSLAKSCPAVRHFLSRKVRRQ